MDWKWLSKVDFKTKAQIQWRFGRILRQLCRDGQTKDIGELIEIYNYTIHCDKYSSIMKKILTIDLLIENWNIMIIYDLSYMYIKSPWA